MQNPRHKGRGPVSYGDDLDNRTYSIAAPAAPKHTLYRITLRVPVEERAVHTLRAALKTLVRRFGLRCVRIEQVRQ